MKEKKYIFIAIMAVILTTIVLGIIFGKGKKEVNSDNPEFVKYISMYTSGVISKKSTIIIKITDDLATKVDQEKADPEKLFEFSPSIKGKATWVDSRTIEFKPEADLPSNTEYFAEFNLEELSAGVPEEFGIFSFTFQTLKQSFEVRIEEQKTTDKKTLRWQKAIGVVQTADEEDLDKIKKVIVATQEGRELAITWREEADENKLFYFEIDSISRKEKASEVIIEWNGDAISSDMKGELKLEIPSLDDFKFMSYKIVHQPDQYIQLQFSDPLKENQYLNGLVTISNVTGLKFIIEDNVIKVYPPYRLDGEYVMKIEEGIKNILDFKLKNSSSIDILFEEIKPAVRFVGDGVILPSSDKGLIVPFEAVNLNAVDVRIVRIYENNITQFLQVNDLNGETQLRRVGKVVLMKTIPLDQSNVVDLGRWNRFYLDLNELIQTEPGAIYRVTINFRKQHSLFTCMDDDDDNGEDIVEEVLPEIESSFNPLTDYEEYSYWDYYDDYYYYDDYSWEDRDDPCKKAYYGARRSVSKN
ncbi:MAG: hypothetical protein ABIJ16_01185, partial [Bacteroidota bacterium]